MHTRQIGAGFFTGGSKDNFLDHFFEVSNIQWDASGKVWFRHGWELVCADAFDIGIERSTTYIKRMCALVNSHCNVFTGQVADQIHKGAGGNCQAAGLLHLGTNPGTDAHFQVGRGELQASVIGLEQNIG